MMTRKLDGFTLAYIEAALWTGVEPPNGHELSGRDKLYNLDQSDLAPETLQAMIADCTKFQARMGPAIAAAVETGEVKFGPDCYGRAGHDFWLTRNGHGAGFWDGHWPEPMASKLDKASKSFGGLDLYMGDDGKVYGQ